MVAVAPVHHGHLWVLADGTPAHAPPGRLTRNDDGQLACHLCGRWFDHLGLHLRRHGWRAEHYRDAVGLTLHVPLCSEQLSQRIATRQKQRYDHDLDVRARFAVGHRLAATGELAQSSAQAARARQQHDRPSGTRAAQLAAQAAALAAGLTTRDARRTARLDQLVAASGAADLADLLRAEYARGATLDSLARLTGLGRRHLRQAVNAAGIDVRPTGQNLPDSKRRRAQDNDTQVARRVGATDIRGWLATQRAAGLTLRALAEQTGRSIPWVQARLASNE